VPVYNEELVIERRINNIFESTYPKNKIEVIIVDSGSRDKTRSIIETNFQNRVILIREKERNGKAHAINLALGVCKGDIIILTDGPTLYDKETIAELVESFRDSSVGGVSALYKVPITGESHVVDSEYTFWSYKDKIRILESRVYSTSWLSGEACAFRNKTITKVDEDTLADDSNIALQLISKGYRVIVNGETYFTEGSPSGVYDYFKIKVRRALGGLIETLRFNSLLFKRQYGYFGLIIFPYRFFAQLVNPIASAITITLAIPAVIESIAYLGIYTLFIGLMLLSIGFILRHTVMVYIYTQLITLIAFFLLIAGRVDVRWTRSTTRS
jgi:cellulose synthase/poly-beta-1,6-N-acetylglucosamine synthase-like glycosyltransferase